MHLFLIIFSLFLGIDCFAVNRFDHDLEFDGLVRIRRASKPSDASSSSEEDHLSRETTKTRTDFGRVVPALTEKGASEEDEEEVSPKNIPAENEVEGSGEGSGANFNGIRQSRAAEGVESSSLEESEFGSRILNDDGSDAKFSEQEANLRVMRDIGLGSGLGSCARLADVPLENSGDDLTGTSQGNFDGFTGSRVVRSEASGVEAEDLARSTRDTLGNNGMESNDEDATVEGSGNVSHSRISRDFEGSGELLMSEPVRVVRGYGSNLTNK